jgi:hypothetical protein
MSTPFRLVRAGVGALLAVGLLYPVAMNVFLSTSLFAKVIDGQPATIDVHFRRGWSFVPGHIHAKDLSIRGRDGNVEWILRLDEVEFDVSLGALAHQRFEASRVYGRGVSFRLRQRLDATPSSPADVADLPPIEGLAPYAVRPPPHPEPELWSDAAYHLWSARLEDVVANDVREVWIDNRRFQGRARIAGRFSLKPIRRVDIGPIRIDVDEGHVRTGASVVLDRLADATVDVRVNPFDPRTMRGSDLLRQVSLKVAMHPACSDFGRIPLPMPEGVGITGAVDVREIVIDLRNGTLQEGTKVDATLPHAAVTRGEHRFIGAVALTGGITRPGGKSRLDFRAQLTDLDVEGTRATPAAEKVMLHVPRMTVTGDARELDLANALADAHFVADATGELPDLRVLSAYIPGETPLVLKGGRGQLTAHLETWRAEKRAAGNANLRIDGLSFRLGNLRVQGGKASVDASFGSLPWETSRMQDAKLSLQIAGGSLASERRPGIPLIRADGLRADATAAVVALKDPLRALRTVISLEGGEIVDPDLLRAYLPKGAEMHILPGRARFSLACQLTLVDHLASGTLDVASEQLGFSFRDFRVGLDLRAKARVHEWHWERGDLALDQADVDMTKVSVDRPGNEAGDRPAPSGPSDRSPSPSTDPALSFGRISLGAKSRHFSLPDPLKEIQLTASLVDARVHDSAIVNAFLPAGAPFAIRAKEGSFSSDIQAAIRAHVLEGTVAARAQRMGIGGRSFHIGGDIDVLAHVLDWDFTANTLAVQDAQVLFSHVAGGLREGPAESFDAAPASARATAKMDFRAERVELWASTPRLDLVKPSRQKLDARVAIVDAELPDATVLERFMPANSILAVESGRARVSANLEVSSTRRTAQGRLDVDLAHTGIRFNETHLAGNFKVSAQLLGYDPDQDLFEVSGSRVTMRDVQVTNASTSTLQWQGDAVFKEATFRLRPRPELEGRLTVEALDASPILAILLGNGLPKIFVGLTRMPHLSASARLTLGASHVALRDLDAHGGDLSIEGIYVLGQGHRAGAFVVGKGPVSVGFRLNDEGAHLRLFGLEGWLREETRASLRLLDEPPPPSDATPPLARP